MVIPALVEAHCHLDKCHTLHRLGDVGGDLRAAIDRQRRDKANWTADDLHRRAARGLDELHAAGCGWVRSHVDWSEGAAPPLAWEVLGNLTQDGIDLNRAALVGIAQMADPALGAYIARTVARDGQTLGALVLGQPEVADGLRAMFALADRYGLALDFHVDETLDTGPDGLEAIADMALAQGFEGPVLCGHSCALMNADANDTARIADKLARAGVAVAALPTTNLYLQGRGTGTPDRRGLTRLRELRAAGVRVVVASDNVADAFCPTGQHDPMAALHLAVLAGHLDPPFERWLAMVTDDAARVLGRDPVQVIGAAVSDLRISAAHDMAELIAGRAGRPEPLAQYLEADI